jgi:hypothetical protein
VKYSGERSSQEYFTIIKKGGFRRTPK